MHYMLWRRSVFCVATFFAVVAELWTDAKIPCACVAVGLCRA